MEIIRGESSLRSGVLAREKHNQKVYLAVRAQTPNSEILMSEMMTPAHAAQLAEQKPPHTGMVWIPGRHFPHGFRE